MQHLSHVKEDEKRLDFINVLYGSTTVLDRLKTILFEDLNQMSRTEMSLEDFEDTNWSHKQAYRNGYKKAVLDYLALTEGVLNSGQS